MPKASKQLSVYFLWGGIWGGVEWGGEKFGQVSRSQFQIQGQTRQSRFALVRTTNAATILVLEKKWQAFSPALIEGDAV